MMLHRAASSRASAPPRPRIVSIAMVRDGSAGAAMARVMSFVMTVFMLVPILAPSHRPAGALRRELALHLPRLPGAWASSRALWLWLRQAETLPRERRVAACRPERSLAAAGEVLRHPVAMGYTLAAGCIFGSFICYLGTSQQIFAEQYGQGDYFALWFGVFAIGIAIAMMVNARLVMRYGMRKLSKWALRGFIVLSAALPCCRPCSWTAIRRCGCSALYLFVNFFCCGIAVRQLQRHRHGAHGPHRRHGGGDLGLAVLADRHRDRRAASASTMMER